METLFRRFLVFIFFPPLLASADPSQSSNIRPTGRPWIDMDYGPYLSATYEISKQNIANKGIAIRLDPGPGGISQGNHFALFETDTLRLAAGWTGSEFIDWHNIAFDGAHGVHSSILGSILFSNPDQPGWAGPDGTFKDPRRKARDGKHYGPLPNTWGQWHGLHVHTNRVILSYRVGDTEILESHASEGGLSNPILSRTLEIGSRSTDLILQAAWLENVSPRIKSVKTSSGSNIKIAYFPASPTREDSTEDNEDNQDAPGSFAGDHYFDAQDPEEFDMSDAGYSIYVRFRTDEGGTLFAQAPPGPEWKPGYKTLFIREGLLVFDIGWVGQIAAAVDVADGNWHEAVMSWDHDTAQVRLYVDGESVASSAERGSQGEGPILTYLEPLVSPRIRIGFTSEDFPEEHSAFHGEIDEVRYYRKTLARREIPGLADRLDHPAMQARWDLGAATGDAVQNLAGDAHMARRRKIEFSQTQPQRSTFLITAVAVRGDSENLDWMAHPEGHLRLNIPKGRNPLRIKILYGLSKPDEDLGAFADRVQSAERPAHLRAMTRGGPAQWTETITTEAKPVGWPTGPYTVEAITLPEDNPYRSWMRIGGFDFFDGGDRAAVCTWQGDVWTVDGLGGELGEFQWRRIATGMFQPLGLKIVDGDIYVTCRDQITVLKDLDSDGETDFYESFNNDAQVTPHFHEFAMDLQTDAAGNFYYAKAGRHALDAVVPHHGTLLRVAPNGSKTEIVANGFRAPNGVCVNGDGTFVLSDQEGHWTPKNRINWVEPGGFYGYMMGYHNGRDPEDFRPPMVWIHNTFDRSPAAQLWVESDRWGPLADHLISLSYGTGEISLVLMEEVEGVQQGGVIKLPIPEMPTGIMRGRFNETDEQLYVAGLFGWSSDKTKPGGFYRVNYTGQEVIIPTALHVLPEGLSISFNRKLDAEFSTDPGYYGISRWTYLRRQQYGSDDYKLSNPGEKGRDTVEVRAVELSKDGKTVRLKIPDMQPAMQMLIQYSLRTADGERFRQEIMNTVHRLP